MQSDPQDFIGRTFGEGGHLIVVGFEGWQRGKKDQMYKLYCPICAADPEVFGDGHFVYIKAALTRGQIPCGCSDKYHYSEEQAIIRIKRIATAKNYVFKGFTEPYKGTYTKMDMGCNNCGNFHNKPTISSFLRDHGCRGCLAKQASERNLVPVEDMVSKFMASGRFTEGHKFTRSSRRSKGGRTIYWDVHCPVCSVDEYVKAGVCSGVFTSYQGSLRTGMQPCRCCETYRWPQVQREYQLKKLMSETEKYSFVGWAGSYKGSQSKVVVECKEHGTVNAGYLAGVLARNRFCPSCADYGFNRSKPAWFYVFKAVGETEFTGYGITRNLEERFMKHERLMAAKGFRITRPCTYLLSGQEAFDLEKKVKMFFPLSPQNVEGFKTEATFGYLYKYVRYFVDENLQKPDEKDLDESEDYDLYRTVLRVPSPGEVHV